MMGAMPIMKEIMIFAKIRIRPQRAPITPNKNAPIAPIIAPAIQCILSPAAFR